MWSEALWNSKFHTDELTNGLQLWTRVCRPRKSLCMSLNMPSKWYLNWPVKAVAALWTWCTLWPSMSKSCGALSRKRFSSPLYFPLMVLHASRSTLLTCTMEDEGIQTYILSCQISTLHPLSWQTTISLLTFEKYNSQELPQPQYFLVLVFVDSSMFRQNTCLSNFIYFTLLRSPELSRLSSVSIHVLEHLDVLYVNKVHLDVLHVCKVQTLYHHGYCPYIFLK